VGLYTNAIGTYLGDRVLDPIFDLLNNRSATAFTHPEAPGCAGASLGYPPGMSEYPFDTVRAMENLLFTGQRRDYSNIRLIFAHGGGTMPFVANRIAGQAGLVSGGNVNASEALAQFQGYLFDTASATSAAQLLGMREFYGGDVSKIVVGTDCEYSRPLVCHTSANLRIYDKQIHMFINLRLTPGYKPCLLMAISAPKTCR
jgi:hypothetical protein